MIDTTMANIFYETEEEVVKALMSDEVQLICLGSFRAEILAIEMGNSLRDLLPIYDLRKFELYIGISKKYL